jgi:DNA-binding winged helix-turn-helix (wHTH) protein
VPSFDPPSQDSARERRGFALYVGLSESAAREYGVDLGELLEVLGQHLKAGIPSAETHALAVVAPVGTALSDLDVVLRATIERPRDTGIAPSQSDDRPARKGVVIDLARNRVLVDDREAGLTFKEFALLEVLVRNDGKTLSRQYLREAIATGDDTDINVRTIDVHIRRLRVRFGDFPDVIRTVQGKGYRFDARSDVSVLRSSTPSPDLI